MTFYIIEDTKEAIEAVMAAHLDGKMQIMQSDANSVLIYETVEAVQIDNAKAYEIMNTAGVFGAGGFAVFNNIPVSEDGKEIFEQRFKNRAGLIESEPGFVGIWVLKPLDSDTYVVLTIWEDEKNFTDWQASTAYNKAHAKRGTETGIDKRPNIFPRPSFVTKYNI